MAIFFLALLIGLLPAYIANNKGKSFFLWWLYGSLLFIIALPHALLMKSNIKNIEKKKLDSGMKKCIMCAEFCKNEAIKCKHCGHEFIENFKSIDEVKT